MFFLRISSLIFITAILLIGSPLPSLGEDDPQVETEPTGRPGMIKISSLPPGAKVKLDGKRIGNTPMVLHGVPAGTHVIRFSKRGFPDYVTRIEVEKDRDLELSIALPKKIYYKWIEQYRQAITSSIVLPGKGQVDNGHTRGWFYFIGYFGTVGFAIFQADAYSKSEIEYNDALELYWNEDINPEEAVRRFRNVTHARNDMIKHKDNYESALKIAIGIWAVNMIDVVLFTVDRPVIYASTPQTFSIYANLPDNRIGLRMNF